MELLKKLYSIYSPSGNEKKMRKFLKWWISQNIPESYISTDKTGNIYVTKGISETYPCLVSHIDQVQKIYTKDFTVIENEDVIFAYSPKLRTQLGLGADDKNGVWCALKCLERFDNIKAVFFVGEEIGCYGSSQCNMEFFDDCRFVLQADRRGNKDLITEISGDTCSSDFLAAIDYQMFGYTPTYGLMTDIDALKRMGLGVSAINISCGYYNPHTDQEFTDKKDLMNCLDFIFHIIESCQRTYSHKTDYGWNHYGWKRGAFDLEDQYLEAQDMIFEMLSYQPDLTAEELLGMYGLEFPLLGLNDYQQIINDYQEFI